MLHPLQILEQYWGHTGFRPNQQKIIEAVLENEDCLALLPTGGGKSVCFQVPALIKEGICIVVSPLIALEVHLSYHSLHVHVEKYELVLKKPLISHDFKPF